MNPEKNGSSFATLPGSICLLILYLVSVRFDAPGLSVLLFTAFIFTFTAWLWGRNALKGLSVGLEGSSTRVFPGQQLRFSVHLTNRKWLPVFWVTVLFPQERQDVFPMPPVHLNWLLPWQEGIAEQRHTAGKRGIYHLDRLDVLSGDGFGLSVQKQSVRPDNRLLFVVYPKAVPVRADLLPMDAAEPEPDLRGHLEDVSLLRGTRAYEAGDPVRRLNWRMLAASGRMEINLYEHVKPKNLCFILDLESFGAYRTYDDSTGTTRRQITHLDGAELENALSLTASLILELSARGCRIRLVLPDVLPALLPSDGQPSDAKSDSSGPVSGSRGGIFDAPTAEDSVPELLTALAGVRYFGGPAAMPEKEVLRAAASLGQIFVLAMSPEKLSIRRLLGDLPEHAVRIIAEDAGEGHPLFPVIERRHLLE